MNIPTAAEIFALVEKWPREAWPQLDYDFAQADFYDIWNGQELHIKNVAHAFVGAGLAWLAEKNNFASMYYTDGELRIAVEIPTPGQSTRMYHKYSGPNILAAVSAAILAAKGSKDAQ